MKQKVYCENCKHYLRKCNLFLLMIAMILTVGVVIVIDKKLALLQVAIVSFVTMLMYWFAFSEEKCCHYGKKEYRIIDTPTKHTETLVVLDEFDLNNYNDCLHYEVK